MKRKVKKAVMSIVAMLMCAGAILYVCDTFQNVRQLQSDYIEQSTALAREMDARELPGEAQLSKDLGAEDYEEAAFYDDLELLALCIEAEAGNQDLRTKRACVSVILNRVDSPDWPDTIGEVIKQKYEFSSYWNGHIDAVWEPAESTYEAVRLELENRSNTYLYFDDVWPQYGTRGEQIGDMYFNFK